MSFICRNGPLEHRHETVEDAKRCWGILPSRPPSVAATAAVSPRPPAYEPRRATFNQVNFVRDLGGDAVHAAKLSVGQCSSYIKELQQAKRKREESVTTVPATDPRLDMLKGLIDLVPDGYFAVQEEDGAPINFVRISRPKPTARTKFAGATKIQTIHGPNLEDAAALWPSGKWSVYKASVVDSLMLLVVDYQGAALRYAQKIGRCCRCNARLTDDRSRHYGIGPECEQYWPWVIASVNERNSA